MNADRRGWSLRGCLLCVLALAAAGCLIDRSDLGGGEADTGVARPDAYVEPGLDASIDAATPPPPDAWALPRVDAWAPDAFTPPDVFVAPDAVVPDAFVAPDAFVGCVPAPEVCNGADDDCDDRFDEAVCEIRLVGGGSTVCEAHTREGSAYLVCNAVASWDLSREICRRFSADYDLVAFLDGAEQDAVRSWSGIDLWMGLTDSRTRVPTATDEDYRWVDTTAPSYTAWDTAAGEPDSSEAEGCVELQTDGSWDARSCAYSSNTSGIVCELKRP